MVVLDTDHMTILEQHDSSDAQRINTRLEQLPTDDIATTIITFEEQTRGWMPS